MPARALRVVQINTTGEGTYGTQTASTLKLMGIVDASLKLNDKVEMVPNIGNLGPGPLAAEVMRSGEGKIEGTFTYEDAPRIANGFFTAIGASTSIAAPYNYPYTAPVSSTQAVYTYTVEYGTTGVTYRAPGTVFSKLAVKGEAGGLWQFSVDNLAQNITSSGGLTVAADHTATPVRVSDTTVYLDAFSSGTIGTTAVSGTIISFDFTMDTKRHLKTYAASLTPGDWGEGKWEGALKLVMEVNTTSKAIVDELISTAPASTMSGRQVRIQAVQDTGGSQKTARLDFAGTRVGGEALFGDREGNLTYELNFAGRYSTGLTNWFACQFSHGSSSTT